MYYLENAFQNDIKSTKIFEEKVSYFSLSNETSPTLLFNLHNVHAAQRCCVHGGLLIDYGAGMDDRQGCAHGEGVEFIKNSTFNFCHKP